MLQSKLLVPRIKKIFPRPRLLSTLENITTKKLTLVVAGAGYGKTSLIAHKISQSDLKTVWYRLDETDIDFLVFIDYLYKGFQKCFRDNSFITNNIKPGTSLPREQRFHLLENLIRKVETAIKGDVILVMDDFHLVQTNTEVCESIEFILDHLPGFMHLVIISRVEPDVRVSRLRVLQEIIEIREQDIQFRMSEIEEMYSHVFNISLPPEIVRSLYNKTKGWVASLILFQYIMKDKTRDDIQNALASLKGSHHVIFEYLEENIFSSLAEETKVFLVKTSLLNELDPEFCDQLLNINCSLELCKQLTNQHLLTFQHAGKTTFYYHHLFKDFLQKKFSNSLDSEVQNQLCKEIASLLKTTGKNIDAIPFYLKGEQYTKAAAEIFSMEEELFNSGQINRIKFFLNQLPETLIDTMAGLLYVKGKLYSFLGESHLAITFFSNALTIFKSEASDENIRKCQLQLGLNAYYTGDISGAELHFETIISDGIENRYIETAGLLILISSILGKIDKADSYAHHAKKTIQTLDGVNRKMFQTWIDFTYSYRFYVSGDFKQAYSRSIELLELYKQGDSQILLPLAYLHIALPAYFLKEFDIGYKFALKGIELLEKMGVRDHQVAWLYYATALNLAGHNRDVQALEYIEKSLHIFESQSNSWGETNAHDLRHFIYLKAGKIERAEHSLMTGIQILKNTDLPFTRGILEIGLASIKLIKEEYDLAQVLLLSAREKVAPSDFYTFKHNLINSKCHMLTGKKNKALAYLEKGLCLAEECGYERHLINEKGWIDSLLLELYSKGVKKSVTQTIFNLRGKEGQNTLILFKKKQDHLSRAGAAVLRRTPNPIIPGLKIFLLGSFRLMLGDKELSENAFKKNLKAIMIIKYLATQQTKGFIHRDELIELIWPEQDVKKTGKRFNVAISFIRKLFEPSIKRGCPSSYLLKQKTGFRLDLGDNGTVDMHTFLDHFRSAVKLEKSDFKAALEHYIRAELLYGGSFLIEDTYTQWCCEQRETLQEKYLLVLTKLIRYSLDKREHFKGLLYCEK